MADTFGLLPGTGSSVHITRQTTSQSEIELKGYQDSEYVLISFIIQPKSQFSSEVYTSSIALRQNEVYNEVEFSAGGYGTIPYSVSFQSGSIRISIIGSVSISRLILTVFGF